MKSSKELHQEAADLREKGIFDKSIAVNDEALQAAWAAKDPGDYAENVACLAITRRVRAGLTNNRLELVLAEGEMSAGVKIAREFGKPEDLALPLYQLAEIQEDLGNFSTALASYKEAIAVMEHNPPATHNRASVIADMKVHMYACAYKAGDKSALDRLHKALSDLEASDEPDSFSKNVWVSGGYIRLFLILKEENPQEATMYLQKAEEIIASDPRLVVRKEQVKQFKTNS